MVQKIHPRGVIWVPIFSASFKKFVDSLNNSSWNHLTNWSLYFLGSRLEHHTWMQGELQKLEERNCQKMAALKNLEEKISTLEKGNLLRGNDRCSSVALKDVRQLLTTSFSIFLNFYNVSHIWFPFRFFFGKSHSESFCLL